MNHTFGDALFGSTRMLAVLLELTLAAHALGLYVMLTCFAATLPSASSNHPRRMRLERRGIFPLSVALALPSAVPEPGPPD